MIKNNQSNHIMTDLNFDYMKSVLYSRGMFKQYPTEEERYADYRKAFEQEGFSEAEINDFISIAKALNS